LEWKDERKKGSKIERFKATLFQEQLLGKSTRTINPKMTRQHIHLGKGQGKNLYNVVDVREITYI
jgi:hypothetical protein